MSYLKSQTNLGLRIVREDGTRPRPSTLLVRMLLQVVDGFAFGIVGLVLMLAGRRHQRFGDIVARTLVVREHR